MDAVKFIEERNRMCNSFSPDCEGCRVDEAKPVMDECCRWMFENPERTVKIVEEWSAAHPRKTRQSVFLEQWPDARIYANGVLSICPNTVCIYRCRKSRECVEEVGACDDCCREFWLQEVE